MSAVLFRSRRGGILVRLAEQARQLLIEAAAVDLARQSQADAETTIKLSAEAIWGLARHGHPFGRLLELTRNVLKPPFDLPAVQLSGKTNEQLGRYFADLRRQGEELLIRRAALSD